MQLSITPSITPSNNSYRRNAVRNQSFSNQSFTGAGFNPLSLDKNTCKPFLLFGSVALGASGVLFLFSQFADRISHVFNG